MADLLLIRLLCRFESDQTAGEVFLFETAQVADFVVDFFQTLERRRYLDDLHHRGVAGQERAATGVAELRQLAKRQPHLPNSTANAFLIGHGCDDFTDRCLGLIVGDAAGADDFVPAAAIVT